LVIRAGRLHRHKIEEKVGGFGFHRSSHMALMFLAKAERSPSQRELAEHLSITPAAMTGILKRLEQDGYIERCAARDSRYNEISITERGREVVLMSREAFLEVDLEMLAGFSDDELTKLSDMLLRVCDNLETKGESK
jgi:DNA-binding MarR family transcriptional regulator